MSKRVVWFIYPMLGIHEFGNHDVWPGDKIHLVFRGAWVVMIVDPDGIARERQSQESQKEVDTLFSPG